MRNENKIKQIPEDTQHDFTQVYVHKTTSDQPVSDEQMVLRVGEAQRSFMRKHGSSSDGLQASLLFYPFVVVGHSGVNTGAQLFRAVFAPADYSKQEEPVADFAHQRSS